MIRESGSGKVGIYTLFQRGEWATTRISLSGLLPQLSERIRLFILLNDVHDEDARKEIETWPNVSYYCSGRNLGVAGGRNFLTKQALRWGAEVLLSYDNDFICPPDYVIRMVSALSGLAHRQPVGIIAPALLNASGCEGLWRDRYRTYLDSEQEGRSNGRALTIEQSELSAFMASRGIEDRGLYYHLGICNWKLHYLDSYIPPLVKLRSLLGKRWPVLSPTVDHRMTGLANDPAFRRRVIDSTEPLEVDCLPGGAHCYFSQTLRRLGGFDNSYNPFGFEDSDLCIRALCAGYRNYLIPDVAIVHDIAQRNHYRPLPVIMATRGKAKRLMLSKYSDGEVERIRFLLNNAILGPIEVFFHGLYWRRLGRVGYRQIARSVASYLKAFFTTYSKRTSGVDL